MRKCLIVVVLSILIHGEVAAEPQPRTLRIGWSGPLSGNSAVLGVDSARAARMVFDKANSDPKSSVRFELIAEDDLYSTAKSMLSYRKLVDIDRVPAMFFLTYGGLFATAPLAEKDDVLLIDPLDCNEEVAKLPSNTFCIAAMTESIGALNSEIALSRNQKRAAIFYFQDDPFMSTVMESSQKALLKASATVALKAGYRGGQSDFKSLLLRAKQEQIDSLYLYGYDETATAMRQARELGLNVSFYSTAVIMNPAFIQAAGSALEGTTFTVFTPANESQYTEFISAFTQKYGAPPILDIATVPTFDAANIIVDFAISYQGDFDLREFRKALRSHLQSLEEYHGVSGIITMSPDGATRSLSNTLRSYEVRKGKRVILP